MLTCGTTFVEPTDGTWIELTSYSDVPNRLATSKMHYSYGVSFPANKNFEYRLKAMNGVGMGDPSSVTVAITDDIPK
jgi:hypothetical protein